MLHSKRLKYFLVGKFGAGFRLNKKWFSSVKKIQIKDIVFDYDVIMVSGTSYDTHSEEAIHRAKFDACFPSSFGGVRAYVRLNRSLLKSVETLRESMKSIKCSLSDQSFECKK